MVGGNRAGLKPKKNAIHRVIAILFASKIFQRGAIMQQFIIAIFFAFLDYCVNNDQNATTIFI